MNVTSLSRFLPSRRGRTHRSFVKLTTRAALLIVTMLLLGRAANAQEAAPPARDALALLEAHCVKCHGGEKTKAGLDLTTREGLLRDGESGAAVAADNSVETSLLYQMVAHLEEPGMPHKEDKLPPAEIAEIAKWLRA